MADSSSASSSPLCRDSSRTPSHPIGSPPRDSSSSSDSPGLKTSSTRAHPTRRGDDAPSTLHPPTASSHQALPRSCARRPTMAASPSDSSWTSCRAASPASSPTTGSQPPGSSCAAASTTLPQTTTRAPAMTTQSPQRTGPERTRPLPHLSRRRLPQRTRSLPKRRDRRLPERTRLLPRPRRRRLPGRTRPPTRPCRHAGTASRQERPHARLRHPTRVGPQEPSPHLLLAKPRALAA